MKTGKERQAVRAALGTRSVLWSSICALGVAVAAPADAARLLVLGMPDSGRNRVRDVVIEAWAGRFDEALRSAQVVARLGSALGDAEATLWEQAASLTCNHAGNTLRDGQHVVLDLSRDDGSFIKVWTHALRLDELTDSLLDEAAIERTRYVFAPDGSALVGYRFLARAGPLAGREVEWIDVPELTGTAGWQGEVGNWEGVVEAVAQFLAAERGEIHAVVLVSRSVEMTPGPMVRLFALLAEVFGFAGEDRLLDPSKFDGRFLTILTGPLAQAPVAPRSHPTWNQLRRATVRPRAHRLCDPAQAVAAHRGPVGLCLWQAVQAFSPEAGQRCVDELRSVLSEQIFFLPAAGWKAEEKELDPSGSALATVMLEAMGVGQPLSSFARAQTWSFAPQFRALRGSYAALRRYVRALGESQERQQQLEQSLAEGMEQQREQAQQRESLRGEVWRREILALGELVQVPAGPCALHLPDDDFIEVRLINVRFDPQRQEHLLRDGAGQALRHAKLAATVLACDLDAGRWTVRRAADGSSQYDYHNPSCVVQRRDHAEVQRPNLFLHLTPEDNSVSATGEPELPLLVQLQDLAAAPQERWAPLGPLEMWVGSADDFDLSNPETLGIGDLAPIAEALPVADHVHLATTRLAYREASWEQIVNDLDAESQLLKLEEETRVLARQLETWQQEMGTCGNDRIRLRTAVQDALLGAVSARRGEVAALSLVGALQAVCFGAGGGSPRTWKALWKTVREELRQMWNDPQQREIFLERMDCADRRELAALLRQEDES